ncbi:ABC transporter permease [Feifania hominis]|uniref:ABC transporter permease n=1 Tax=Feifania hominis TaxID=2763660 RepID=A0A926DGN6_9FIRM|nr:ABC transporter permease [Feifania hominis]MBC8536954.1 ABC transporter permease [Feifania hominis]
MYTSDQSVSKERREYLRSKKRRKRLILTIQISLLVGFLALWEVLARIGVIDSFVMSQPSRILATFLNLSQNNLLLHVGVTVYETVVGFLLGTILGTLCAIALWWSDFFSRVFEPYLVVLNSLPKVALGPVIIIWAGAGTRAIIVMALAISLIVTILEVLGGFSATDRDLIKMGRTFDATRRELFTKIVFPSNIRTIFNSVKISIGLSLVGVISGEFLVSKAGLGYLIVYGGQVFKLDLVMASVIILAILAAALYQIVRLVEKIVLKRLSHQP